MNLAVVTPLIPPSPNVCCIFLPCAYFSVKPYVPSCACCCCACVQTAGVTHAEVSTPCSVPINPRLIRSQSPREAKRSSAKMDVSTCARIKGLSLKVPPKRLGGYRFRIFPTPTQNFQARHHITFRSRPLGLVSRRNLGLDTDWSMMHFY